MRAKKRPTFARKKKRTASKKVLSDAKPKFYFKLMNGPEIKNILELANALRNMPNEVFYHHSNDQKNDFGNWIRDVFKLEELSKEIWNCNKLETEVRILRFLVEKLSK